MSGTRAPTPVRDPADRRLQISPRAADDHDVVDYEFLPPEHPDAVRWMRAKRRRNIEIVTALVACAGITWMFAFFCKVLTG
jgi:hypothetical protein